MNSRKLLVLACFFLLLLPAVSFSGENSPDQDEQAVSEDLEDDFLDTLYEEAEKGEAKIADPLLPINRLFFHFNDKLYFWVLKPVATGYRKVIPGIVRTGIENFFTNITTPVRFINCLLQGKGEEAGHEWARFFVNSTVGVLGFGDPAKRLLKRTPTREDLGQTLGKWGIGNGIYIVLPVFGPSSLRDSAGLIGDFFLNPASYITNTEIRIAVSGLKTVNSTSFRLGDYESLKSASLDPYETLKNAYIQSRNSKIGD